MAEQLAKVLEQLINSKESCNKKVDKVEKPKYQDVEELINHYKTKQAEYRRGTKIEAKKSPDLFCLNFAKYERSGRFGYKMIPPGKIQVPGFSNGDTYDEVVAKGAQGLGLTTSPERLSLIVSNGLIRDAPLPSGHSWTLGNYVSEFGGVQARGKRTFGIYMPYDVVDEEAGISLSMTSEAQPHTSGEHKKRKSQSSGRFIIKQGKFDESAGSACHPISLNSSQNTCDEPLEISFDESESTTYCTYCPITSGKVIPGIAVKGREGIWRLMSCKFHSTHEEILDDMNIGLIEQPEVQNFFLMELYSGGVAYLQAQVNSKSEMSHENINYFLKEKRIVHNKQHLTLPENAAIPLLVISPNHGNVMYKWEKRVPSFFGEWKTIEVPPWTCLLYVNNATQYRCTVETSFITFDVKVEVSSRKNTTTDLLVPYKELQFKQVVGRGSFGEVYRGEWNGRDVALERIPIPSGEDKCKMIANSAEIAALKLLKHPNIVCLLGYSASEKDIVIIMNYIEGKNLHSMIFGKEKIISRASNGQKLHIAIGVAYGIQFMHSRDPLIIHQDIKPLNVMVTADLQGVYICDMGIAKLRAASEATVTTAMPYAKGTYPYMAPEMYGPNRRGTAFDVYAFGCLMIELFGERKVWGELVTAQIMQKICGSFNVAPEPPVVEHLPDHYKSMCKSCCQLDPAKRPHIATVVKQLEAFSK